MDVGTGPGAERPPARPQALRESARLQQRVRRGRDPVSGHGSDSEREPAEGPRVPRRRVARRLDRDPGSGGSRLLSDRPNAGRISRLRGPSPPPDRIRIGVGSWNRRVGPRGSSRSAASGPNGNPRLRSHVQTSPHDSLRPSGQGPVVLRVARILRRGQGAAHRRNAGDDLVPVDAVGAAVAISATRDVLQPNEHYLLRVHHSAGRSSVPSSSSSTARRPSLTGLVRGGSGVKIEHQVTIGAESGKAPRSANNVFIGAGAKVPVRSKLATERRSGPTRWLSTTSCFPPSSGYPPVWSGQIQAPSTETTE